MSACEVLDGGDSGKCQDLVRALSVYHRQADRQMRLFRIGRMTGRRIDYWKIKDKNG
jgi:hypothetical protein